jgi:hypothetical protein
MTTKHDSKNMTAIFMLSKFGQKKDESHVDFENQILVT